MVTLKQVTTFVTYRQSKERIGRLNERATFYTAVRERTLTGGEVISWVEWVTVFAAVQNLRASEEYAADRRTAFNTKKIVVRKPSVDGVNEVMVLELNGEQFDIEAINTLEDAPRNHYLEITATRRTDTINPLLILNLVMAFSQKNTAFTGEDWTIAAGTLPDPDDVAETDIHQRCHLYRSGLRQVYGTDFTIETGNVLAFTQKVLDEVLLYHQYNPV